jgi:Ca2+/Na+ antiporter
MHPGVIGGIIGGIGGVIGGLIGTYFSVKNTKGPKERDFVIKCAVIGWIAIAVLVLLFIYLPNPYKFLLWIPYGFALFIGIRYGNKKQLEIRKQEEEHREKTLDKKSQ